LVEPCVQDKSQTIGVPVVKTENRDCSRVAHGNLEDVLWTSSRMNLIMI